MECIPVIIVTGMVPPESSDSGCRLTSVSIILLMSEERQERRTAVKMSASSNVAMHAAASHFTSIVTYSVVFTMIIVQNCEHNTLGRVYVVRTNRLVELNANAESTETMSGVFTSKR